MRCKHRWEVLDKTVLPSGVEQMKAADMKFDMMEGSILFSKTVMVICHCTACDEIEKFTEKNP